MIISRHAIEQARERVYLYRDKSDEYILEDLQRRLANTNMAESEYILRAAGAREIIVEGISLVVAFNKSLGMWAVITCLGDREYRHWFRKERNKYRGKAALCR
jgi:hypothetical protein